MHVPALLVPGVQSRETPNFECMFYYGVPNCEELHRSYPGIVKGYPGTVEGNPGTT